MKDKKEKQNMKVDIQLEKIRRERIRNLNLEDDVFFREVAKDVGACCDVLRLLLGKPNLKLTSAAAQYSIRTVFNRSLILDTLASDGVSLFNVEVENGDKDDHIKRARYHQSLADVNTFDKGTKFKELQDLYIVFITSNDFLSLGKPIGKVRRTIEDTGVDVSNGVWEVYANTESHVGMEGSVYELLQYIRNTEYRNDDCDFPNLVNRVNY